jgi:hypothetical protein
MGRDQPVDYRRRPGAVAYAYAARWSIEVVLAQMRQILGVGQARNRTARAVERTVPFGLTVYTLIILWYTSTAVPPRTSPLTAASHPGTRPKPNPRSRT